MPSLCRTLAATLLAALSLGALGAGRAFAQADGRESPLDGLDPSRIPAAERYAWQPKEVVAVLGEHRGRHGGRVHGLAFRPDGKLLASSGDDGILRLWDPATLRETASIPSGRVRALEFSPDGMSLLTADFVGSRGVCVWELSGPDPTERARIAIDRTGLTAVAVAWPQKLAATASAGGTLTVWDLSVSPPASKAAWRARAYATALAFTSDGKTLAASGSDGVVRLWDVSAAPPRETRHFGYVATGLAFQTTDTSLVAWCIQDRRAGTVSVWDLSGPEPTSKRSLSSDLWRWTVGAVSGDRTLFLHAGDSGAVGLLDLGTGAIRALKTTPPPLESLDAAALSPDGQALAVAFDTIIRVSPVTGLQPRDRVERVRSVAFSPDGKTLAAGYAESQARLWNLSGAEPIEGDALPHRLPLLQLTFAPDGNTLATQDEGAMGVGGPTLYLWDVTKAGGGSPVRIGGGQLGIWTVGYRANGELLAAALDEAEGAKHLNLYVVRNGKLELLGPLVNDGRVGDVALAARANRLATGEDRGLLSLWDVSGAKPRAVDTITGGPWTRLALSPDGATLAGAAYRRTSLDACTVTVHVWDVRSGQAKEVAVIEDHTDRVRGMAFNADGTALATAGDDGRVVVVDMAGKKLHAWRLPLPVRAVCFNPDGRHLAWINGDGTAYVVRLGN